MKDLFYYINPNLKCHVLLAISQFIQKKIKISQGCSEGTSSVSFELLTINCDIEFINLLIFNCLMSKKKKLFMFNCLTSNVCFKKNRIFCKQNRMVVYGRTSLVLDFEITQENDYLLSSRYK